jgi:hypothetical protein
LQAMQVLTDLNRRIPSRWRPAIETFSAFRRLANLRIRRAIRRRVLTSRRSRLPEADVFSVLESDWARRPELLIGAAAGIMVGSLAIGFIAGRYSSIHDSAPKGGSKVVSAASAGSPISGQADFYTLISPAPPVTVINRGSADDRYEPADCNRGHGRRRATRARSAECFAEPRPARRKDRRLAGEQ